MPLTTNGAYRSLPVREPSECGVVLPVEPDKSLFHHNSLPFGSSGSVWSYLRVADVLSFLAVSLLIVPPAHFVDDFYQSEDEERLRRQASQPLGLSTRAWDSE